MEPLIEISRDKWSELRELYRTIHHSGVIAGCILDTHIANPALSEILNFKVYCPEGKMCNGMIAIQIASDESLVNMMIHPLTEGMKPIEESLLKTAVIDWNRNIMVASASPEVLDSLEKLKNRLGVNVHYDDSCKAIKHVLSRHSKPYDNLSCPQNTYIGPLRPQHIDLVNKTWTYCNGTSHKYFRTLMEQGLVYVLYSNEHQPLSWVTVNESGALTHLYCLEEHRRKGYSKYVTKYVTNELLQKGRDVIAFTLEDNVNPQNLFTQMGFEIVDCNYWLFINKKK